MTEEQWLACTDPMLMLEFLRGRASDRKLRLFGVACSRRVWAWLDPRARVAVEVAERFADGLADSEELRAARLACTAAGASAAWYPAASNAAVAARNAALSAQAGLDPTVERAAQADLLRDLFGNPFRPLRPRAASRSPGRMASSAGAALALYEERSLPEGTLDVQRLAEALEDASCTEEPLLGHLRRPGPHVRGCFAVDWLLGRQ
jgi:hypothetical protein